MLAARRRVSESILLTDTDVAPVRDAVALLDGWRAESRALLELGAALGEPGVRALLLTTSDPSLLRSSIELAHARGVPVVVGCADETARRRAVELKAEEWFLLPGDAEGDRRPHLVRGGARVRRSARRWRSVSSGSSTSRCCTTRSPGCPRCR